VKRLNEAAYILDESIYLLQFEFALRMHLEHKSKHSKMKIDRCVTPYILLFKIIFTNEVRLKKLSLF